MQVLRELFGLEEPAMTAADEATVHELRPRQAG
jgi:hypothetical protein